MIEFETNEQILFGDSSSQVYLIRAAEDIKLKQLEGKKNVLTQLVVKTNEPRIGFISGCNETDTFISIINMPVLLEGETNIKVNIYNNSYFKGISISKGDVLGTLTIN